MVGKWLNLQEKGIKKVSRYTCYNKKDDLFCGVMHQSKELAKICVKRKGDIEEWKTSWAARGFYDSIPTYKLRITKARKLKGKGLI